MLSVAMPGLGHFYCGKPLLGVMYWLLGFVGWALFLLGWGVLGWELSFVFPVFVTAWMVVWTGAAIGAARNARRLGGNYELRGYNLWYFYLLLWLVGLLLPNWLLVQHSRENLLTTYVLYSDAMRPSLLPGDGVMVDLRAGTRENLDRGAVVASLDAKDGKTVRFLRVLGLAGETVEVSSQGLAINGKMFSRRQVGQDSYPKKSPEGEWTEQKVMRFEEQLGERTYELFEPLDVAAGKVNGRWSLSADQLLLLGDNRAEAGGTTIVPTPARSVIGRVFLIRASKDPKTDSWRKDRRRLPVP